jgi:sporulation protein YlmC with PRC-barrel domain
VLDVRYITGLEQSLTTTLLFGRAASVMAMYPPTQEVIVTHQPEVFELPDDAHFRGHDVVDENGVAVGKITDIVYDHLTEQPRWGVVATGLLKAAHYVPLVAKTYMSESGAVVVPYDKHTILHSPKAARDHVLSPMKERELEHHYALAQ